MDRQLEVMQGYIWRVKLRFLKTVVYRNFRSESFIESTKYSAHQIFKIYAKNVRASRFCCNSV